MELRPLSSFIGAEISGVDISKPIDDATADRLRFAFRDRLLLLLRNQDISVDDQTRFGNLFGDVRLRTKYSVPAVMPLAQFVSNARPDGILGDVELTYHQDHCFYDLPLKALVLYAIEIPPSGSITKFRSAIALHDHLPDELRKRTEKVRNLFDGDLTPPYDPAKAKPDQPRAWHSYVWTDPESGQKSLMCSPTTIATFEGVSQEDGNKLLNDVWAYAAAHPEFEYAHQWRPGDVIVWHNCLSQHARMPFNGAEKRTLRRTQIHYPGSYNG